MNDEKMFEQCKETIRNYAVDCASVAIYLRSSHSRSEKSGVSYHKALLADIPSIKRLEFYQDTGTKSKTQLNRLVQECKGGAFNLIIARSFFEMFDPQKYVSEIGTLFPLFGDTQLYFETEQLFSGAPEFKISMNLMAIAHEMNLEWKARNRYYERIGKRLCTMASC